LTDFVTLAPAELDRATTSPEGPAGPVSVTTPVDDAPPKTVVGFKTSVATEAGLTVRLDDFEDPAKAAAMFTTVEEETGVVAISNVAEECPPPTVTVPGTEAAALPLDSVTTIPAVGAAPESVTVPEDFEP